METLRQILYKRVKHELFVDNIADRIAVYSGGVLRELIHITILRAGTRKQNPCTSKH